MRLHGVSDKQQFIRDLDAIILSREFRSTRTDKCSSVALSNTNATRRGLRLNPSHRRNRQITNDFDMTRLSTIYRLRTIENLVLRNVENYQCVLCTRRVIISDTLTFKVFLKLKIYGQKQREDNTIIAFCGSSTLS